MIRRTFIDLRPHVFLVLAGLMMLSGCPGPSRRIQQGKNLSTSGILYAEAVNGLLDVTIDRVIDFDSTEAIRIRRWSNEDTLKKAIQDRDTALVGLLRELNSFRRYTQQLKVYFANLQALSDSSVQADTGAAVRELSAGISNANRQISSRPTMELNEAEADSIAALSKLVAKGVHAAKISAALRRDAEIIGEQLVLHEKLLDSIADMLEARFEVENDEFRNAKVISPYANKEVQIGNQWKKDRKTWLKSQFTLESLNKAREASRQLRGVWEQILLGRSDLGSITSLLQDINEFAQAVNEINASNESEGGSQ